MMAKPRLDLSAFVGKLHEEQDGDVLRTRPSMASRYRREVTVWRNVFCEVHER
jgi:hypothetical protein